MNLAVGFNPRQAVKFSASRQRRLISGVADATRGFPTASPALMVFEKIAQPDSADDVARVVYSRRPAAEAARVNNSRHTGCCIYFSKTINAGLNSFAAAAA